MSPLIASFALGFLAKDAARKVKHFIRHIRPCRQAFLRSKMIIIKALFAAHATIKNALYALELLGYSIFTFYGLYKISLLQKYHFDICHTGAFFASRDFATTPSAYASRRCRGRRPDIVLLRSFSHHATESDGHIYESMPFTGAKRAYRQRPLPRKIPFQLWCSRHRHYLRFIFAAAAFHF